jgi:hypothetical protein
MDVLEASMRLEIAILNMIATAIEGNPGKNSKPLRALTTTPAENRSDATTIIEEIHLIVRLARYERNCMNGRAVLSRDLKS